MHQNIPARNQDRNPFATLRRFTQARRVEEHCELCSLVLAPTHRHLLEIAKRQVLCACDGCALRFEGVIGGRFKLIPREICSIPGFRVTDSFWESLAIPINLAFFFQSSPKNGITVLYPSPAGATESLLPLSNWTALADDNPSLPELQPDVQALLVNRVTPPGEYYIVPIDKCFELVGIIRIHWRGLSGGEAAWQEIASFFQRLKGEAVALPEKRPEPDYA